MARTTVDFDDQAHAMLSKLQLVTGLSLSDLVNAAVQITYSDLTIKLERADIASFADFISSILSSDVFKTLVDAT